MNYATIEKNNESPGELAKMQIPQPHLQRGRPPGSGEGRRNLYAKELPAQVIVTQLVQGPPPEKQAPLEGLCNHSLRTR